PGRWLATAEWRAPSRRRVGRPAARGLRPLRRGRPGGDLLPRLSCSLQDELERAFRFIMLGMDKIAMHEKFIFIYCFLGVDWSHPELASRLRHAYDILPNKYSKNLRRLYVLHATQGLRVTMWTFWAWLTKRTWEKIEYVGSLAALCELVQPG
ncbi:unnamed protein product, partial [Prorocentrum cordatum]